MKSEKSEEPEVNIPERKEFLTRRINDLMDTFNAEKGKPNEITGRKFLIFL